jgi:hypothetical protein
MNFWQGLCEEMAHASKELEVGAQDPPLLPPALPAWLRSVQDEEDAACVRWIKFGDLPEGPELRYQMICRMNWGREMALLMWLSPWAPPEHNQALHWLLIETWNHAGIARVETTVREQRLERLEQSAIPARREGG